MSSTYYSDILEKYKPVFTYNSDNTFNRDVRVLIFGCSQRVTKHCKNRRHVALKQVSTYKLTL